MEMDGQAHSPTALNPLESTRLCPLVRRLGGRPKLVSDDLYKRKPFTSVAAWN